MRPRMCPETTETAPNSPMARAFASTTPYTKRPADIGQRHAPEGLPATGAEQNRGFLFLGALLLHQRNQLARDEREGDENSGENNARRGEDDM